MIEEGVRIEDIDGALTSLGMPIGPITLLDEVGIDVGAHVMSGNMAQLLKGREGFKINYSMPKMFEAGLHGRKAKKGFYIMAPQSNGVSFTVFPLKPRTGIAKRKHRL